MSSYLLNASFIYWKVGVYSLWRPDTAALLRLGQISRKSRLKFVEWFSFECRKTKTKVITLSNHKKGQSSEPIITRRKYKSPVLSAGKRV